MTGSPTLTDYFGTPVVGCGWIQGEPMQSLNE